MRDERSLAASAGARRRRRPAPHCHRLAAAVYLVFLLMTSQRCTNSSAAERSTGKVNEDDTIDLHENSFVNHYVIEGDIMLGTILSIHEHHQVRPCGDRLRKPGVVQQVEAVVYAVMQVNEAQPPILPPGVTLGTVILDDCAKSETALARALHFLPVGSSSWSRTPAHVAASINTRCKDGPSSNETVDSRPCAAGIDSGVGRSPLSGGLNEPLRKPDDSDGRYAITDASSYVRTDEGRGGRTGSCLSDLEPVKPPMELFYDVVGLIGPESSTSSVMVANLLGMFGIPLISPTASSDVLSDKTRYPYFLRMAPPDRYQVDAMLHIIDHFKWSYIAAVYSKGNYGEGAVEHLKLAAVRHSVCIGSTLAMSPAKSSRLALRENIDTKLVKIGVRVVVLFTDQEDTKALFTEIQNMQLARRFVWIGSDGLGLNIDNLYGLQDVAVGALTLTAFSNDVKPFEDYFRNLRTTSTRNPWFPQMWSDLANCTWSKSATNTSRRCIDIVDLYSSVSPEPTVSILIDAVHVFADALSRLLAARCPHATNRDERKACISGPKLLCHLKTTNYSGYNGNISFDSNGDIRGKYEIINFQRNNASKNRATGRHHHSSDDIYKAVRVGIWDTIAETLIINDSSIKWYLHDDSGIELEPAPGSRVGSVGWSPVPASPCGQRCRPDEVYSYFKDSCCWHCRRCAINEIATSNATKCEVCPTKTWPAGGGNQTCVPIPVVDERWQTNVAIFFDVIGAVGVLYCAVVLGVYVRHRNCRLIKATSRELSYVMLSGICLQYCLIAAITVRPNEAACYTRYIGFHVSFTVVYAPLLTRTNRIYRIFTCARRSATLPTLTSPVSQVIIALILVAIQLLINAITVVTSPPSVELRMPVPTERLVEVTCDVPVAGFITSLLYNVLLLVVCTWYAFKTRMLPDNFNESRYITLCVYTTLVIWLAFVPSYFTTIHAYQRLVLTSSALALNATVMLLCLYTPRIYAVYQEIKFSGNAGGAAGMAGASGVGGCPSGTVSGAVGSGVVGAVGIRRPKVVYRGPGQQLRRTFTINSNGSPPCSAVVQTGTTTVALVNAERSV